MIDKNHPVVREYLSERGRIAGSVTSKKKIRAAKRNGRKGGAPKGNKNAAAKKVA